MVIARFGLLGAVLATIALLLFACATPEPPKPVPPAQQVAVPPTEPPKPVPPPLPQLSPAEAKVQATKLATESVTVLQSGDEASAQRTLEQALAIDPANDLAKKLMGQIKANPQKELGPASWPYTVQRGESLSTIAARYLGDRYLFYMLAKYNDIRIPNNIMAEQVIKIPGKRPPVTPPSAPSQPPKPPPPAGPTPGDTSLALMRQAIELRKNGDLKAAYDKFGEAAKLDPTNTDAVSQRDGTRQQLASRCEQEAARAIQRQDFDEAIKKWNCVLELDPTNQKAKRGSELAIERRNKIQSAPAR